MKRYVILKDDLEIEQDSIIDTQTNTLYECCSSDMEALCELLNKQDTKWQKLKEWLEKAILRNKDNIISKNDYENVLVIMQEFEGEDE